MFKDVARQKSVDLGTWDMLRLDYKLHHDPPLSPSIRFKQWSGAYNDAIFELIYNIGIDAVEYLTSVAFGEYDWQQTAALIVLCRLYLDGKLPAGILKQIDENFGNMEYDTQESFTRELLDTKKVDPRFEDVFNQMKSPYFLYTVAKLGKSQGGACMTRDELIALGKRIIPQDDQESGIQALMDTFDLNVPYPKGSRLFYFPEGYDGNVDELEDYNPIVEDVVDKCLAYVPRGDENEDTLLFPLL